MNAARPSRHGRYQCRATNSGHVSIREDRLDAFTVEGFGFAWQVETPPDASDTARVTELLTTAAELAQRRSEASEMMFEPGINMTVVRRKLADIESQPADVEAAIIRERWTMASESIAAEPRAAWIAAGVDDYQEAGFPEF